MKRVRNLAATSLSRNQKQNKNGEECEWKLNQLLPPEN
jgi:hypothetical protein